MTVLEASGARMQESGLQQSGSEQSLAAGPERSAPRSEQRLERTALSGRTNDPPANMAVAGLAQRLEARAREFERFGALVDGAALCRALVHDVVQLGAVQRAFVCGLDHPS